VSINRGNHENIEMNRRSFENGGGFFSEVKGKYDAALFMMFSQVCILVCLLFFSSLALRGAAADRNTGGEQKDERGGKKKGLILVCLIRVCLVSQHFEALPVYCSEGSLEGLLRPIKALLRPS
jgi:hypothetical protein